jgi:hypothetical protein
MGNRGKIVAAGRLLGALFLILFIQTNLWATHLRAGEIIL